MQAFSAVWGGAAGAGGVHLGSNFSPRLRWRSPNLLRDGHGLRPKSTACIANEAQTRSGAPTGRTVEGVHGRQPSGLWEHHQVDRVVSDWATRELLGLILDGSVGDDIVDAIAGDIDAGAYASAVERPDELWSDGDDLAVATTRLTVVFELARRAAVPEPPDVVRGPADVAAIARRQLGGLRRERVIVIVCDAANRPLRTIVVSDGAVDRSLMPVREILNAVLRWDGCAFAVAHNHPCGEPEPSDADRAATQLIAEASRIVGLRFLGHIATGSRRWAAVTT